MELKYFDKWECDHAAELIEKNPIEAKIRFENYLNKYPKDYVAYSYYASILISLQEFDKAKKMLDTAEYLLNNDNRLVHYSDKIKYIKQNVYFDRLRLLTYQGKYDEVCKLCYTSKIGVREDKNIDSVILFCEKQLGKINKKRISGKSYLYRQILEYSEEDFWHHVEKHLADCNSILDNPNKNVFVPDFPFKEVVKEIKDNLYEDKKICSGFYDDTYIFRYDHCGREDNRLVNYIKVVCFHNTKDIITILPVEYGEAIPHVDLNYMIQEKTIKEIKRQSSIEKFNKRFKR